MRKWNDLPKEMQVEQVKNIMKYCNAIREVCWQNELLIS